MSRKYNTRKLELCGIIIIQYWKMLYLIYDFWIENKNEIKRSIVIFDIVILWYYQTGRIIFKIIYYVVNYAGAYDTIYTIL